VSPAARSSLTLAALLISAVRVPGRWAAACFALAGVVLLALAAGLVPGFARLPLGGLSINTPKALAGLAALAVRGIGPMHSTAERQLLLRVAASGPQAPLRECQTAPKRFPESDTTAPGRQRWSNAPSVAFQRTAYPLLSRENDLAEHPRTATHAIVGTPA